MAGSAWLLSAPGQDLAVRGDCDTVVLRYGDDENAVFDGADPERGKVVHPAEDGQYLPAAQGHQSCERRTRCSVPLHSRHCPVREDQYGRPQGW